MKNKLSLSQSQKPILAPAMQQSIEVLLIPLTDLTMAIEQELQNNPLLEIDETPTEPRSEEQDMADKLAQADNSLDMGGFEREPEEEIQEERSVRRDETLEEHLLRQLRVEVTDPLELKIGEFIIGNIDEDGYLALPAQEIADSLGIQDLDTIEKVIDIIRNFDPAGVGSRSLKECLLTQADAKFTREEELVRMIITEYLPELGLKKYAEIAKKIGVPLDQVREAARIIATLDPRPARNYRPLGANIYIKPDVFILQDSEENFRVHLNQEEIPPLRINTTYKSMLAKGNLRPEEKAFIKERMGNAIQFIRAIEQRGSTIRKIAEYLLDRQKDFFRHGHSSLVPMNLNDVAQALERNESTISRAISNKYIDTPQGIFPIKFFFSQGVTQDDGETAGISSRSIKEEIRALVEQENRSSPLSDQDIQNQLLLKGIKVARRTIAKYRLMLNIMPSNLRKE